MYVKYRVGEESPYHCAKPTELDISFIDTFTHHTFINGVTAYISHSHNSAYFPVKLRSIKTLKTWTSWHFVLFTEGYGDFLLNLYILTNRSAILEVYACDGLCAAN